MTTRNPYRNPYRTSAPEVAGDGGGGAPYVSDATNFDGTSDFIRAAAMTGEADGSKGVASFWANLNGGDGVQQAIIGINSNRLLLTRQTDNKFRLLMQTSAPSTVAIIGTTLTQVAADGWSHHLLSWDISTSTELAHWYMDDVETKATTTLVGPNNIDYTSSPWTVGANWAGGARLNACLSEVYFNIAEYLDFSVEDNRRLFIDASGNPVDLGSDGSTPTGTAPLIYLPNAFDTFELNAGSGSNFTVTGALTACADAP